MNNSEALAALYTAIPSPSSDSDKPYTTLSYAQSLDGSIALRSDQPLLLSSPQAMEMTHMLRGNHEGIMVGVNTILADNPQLTTRYGGGEHPRPIILDTSLRTPPDACIFNHPKPPLLVCAEDHPEKSRRLLEDAGGEIFVSSADQDRRIDLQPTFEGLKIMGINSLMVEGGASVISSLLEAKVLDACVITIAPIIIGGLHPFSHPILPPAWIPEPNWEILGSDIILWGEVRWKQD